MNDLVLDASFALHWFFEDEVTERTESVLTLLQNQAGTAWVPTIWLFELLNGLGKGVARGRVDHGKAIAFWRELKELPVHIEEIPVDEKLLETAVKFDLAVYDACYLSLALLRGLPIATGDAKLQRAASQAGVVVIAP